MFAPGILPEDLARAGIMGKVQALLADCQDENLLIHCLTVGLPSELDKMMQDCNRGDERWNLGRFVFMEILVRLRVQNLGAFNAIMDSWRSTLKPQQQRVVEESSALLEIDSPERRAWLDVMIRVVGGTANYVPSTDDLVLWEDRFVAMALPKQEETD